MNNIISCIFKSVKEDCSLKKGNSKHNNCSEHAKRGLYYDFSPIDVCEDEDKRTVDTD